MAQCVEAIIHKTTPKPKVMCIKNFLTFIVTLLLFSSPLLAQEETVKISALLGYNFDSLPPTLWQLPKQLEEVSGLALMSDGRLFVHQERRGVVWEVDWQKGTLVKSFHLGKGIKSHFVGIAILGTRFYMINEKGGITYFHEGFPGEGKPYSSYDTGTGQFCDASGLAARPDTSELLILCGKPQKKTPKDQLTVFAWNTVTREKVNVPFLSIPLPAELAGIEPSGIELLPDGSGFLVLTAKERFIIDISWKGEIRSWQALQKDFHKTPAGLTITPDGAIILADQGSRAQLTVYQPLISQKED